VGPSCTAYFASIDCIVSKSPSTKDTMEKSKATLRGIGQEHSEPACKTGHEGIQQSLKALGCPTTDSGAVPPPTPAPVATTPSSDWPPKIPAGKSSPPTPDEWAGQTREVTVLGSGKLNCETKQVREWIRVSCRGKNDTGGEPTTVRLTRGGGRGDEFVFAANKVTSLVYRFFEGISMEAEFSWTDKSKTLVIAWPRGAPEPPARGVFR
jgi:hypothetical protein